MLFVISNQTHVWLTLMTSDFNVKVLSRCVDMHALMHMVYFEISLHFVCITGWPSHLHRSTTREDWYECPRM